MRTKACCVSLPTLEGALAQSEEGATISLGPGTYRLERALTVERQSVATATTQGDEWLPLVYPDDFEGGNTAVRGAYTLLWETEGQFVAYDGSFTGGGAGP